MGICLCEIAVGLDCGEWVDGNFEWVDGNLKNKRLEVITNRTTSNPSAVAQASPQTRLFPAGACLTRLLWDTGATMLATLSVVSVSNVAPGPAEECATGVSCCGCAPPGWNKLDACMSGPISSA